MGRILVELDLLSLLRGILWVPHRQQVRTRATFSKSWAQGRFPNNTVGEAQTRKRGRDERAVAGHFAGFSRLSGSNTPQRQTKQG